MKAQNRFQFLRLLVLAVALFAQPLLSMELPEELRENPIAVESNAVYEALQAGKIDRARLITLSMMTYLPDQTVNHGILTYGQRFAARAVLEFLSQQDEMEAFKFLLQVIPMAHAWKTEVNHDLAGLWDIAGNIAIQNGDEEFALKAWKISRRNWESKTLLWKNEEPEKFALYQGGDRFNPLQMKVEAKLVFLAKKHGERKTAREIEKHWKWQDQTLQKAHTEDEGFAITMYRKSLKRAQQEAEEFLGAKSCAQNLK